MKSDNCGDIANKHLHEQIQVNEERVKRSSPFTPIPNELTSTTRWTPNASLPTGNPGTITWVHQLININRINTQLLLHSH